MGSFHPYTGTQSSETLFHANTDLFYKFTYLQECFEHISLYLLKNLGWYLTALSSHRHTSYSIGNFNQVPTGFDNTEKSLIFFIALATAYSYIGYPPRLKDFGLRVGLALNTFNKLDIFVGS